MRNVLKIVITFIISFLTNSVVNWLSAGYIVLNSAEKLVIIVVTTTIIFLFLAPAIAELAINYEKKLEKKLIHMNFRDFIICLGGCMIGLIMVTLVGVPLNNFGVAGSAVTLALYMIIGYMGYKIAYSKKDEIIPLFSKNAGTDTYGRPKILDTSVIIDGRILDILQTGFIEGKIIIPNFVLEELRHIADSADSLKRVRGRLGLDILNQISNQLTVDVEIIDWNKSPELEVDSRLLKMSEELNAFIVTNDYNLNKVAEFQKVPVLNINELSNAVKSVVLPGQDMTVNVIKDGKEYGQGVAYLNDGTMIVVENGHQFIGENVEVTVTSVLQTSAGRMIFAKPIEEQ